MKRMMYELSVELIEAINNKAKLDRVQKSKIVEDALRKQFKMDKK